MPGIVSSLLNSATGAVTSGLEGEQDKQTRMLAALKRRQDEELRQAQIANLSSEARDRDKKAALPPKYEPTSHDEAVNFYKDTHNVKDTGPVPGSPAWLQMREADYKLRAKYHVGGNAADRAGIDLNHAITTAGQEIDDTRADINLTDKNLKKYEDVNVTTRPENPKRVPGFIADSTDAASLTAGRRRLISRDSTLTASRDQMAREQRKRLGFRTGEATLPETATPSGNPASPQGAGAEAEIQTAKDQLATVFNSPDATSEDKQAAQQAYYTRRQRIQQKYNTH